MLRTAVIGMGPIGNRHADIYTGDPAGRTRRRVRHPPGPRGRGCGSGWRVPASTPRSEMLRALKPDVVSVTTGGYEYGSDHYEPTMQALEAGCHVLGEKPICNEIAKAEEMVAKAHEKGVCYGINLNHRFTAAARLAKRWHERGAAGSPALRQHEHVDQEPRARARRTT